eukprot:GEMP01051309.1.p1 GENE.GEMP01051309.1~~GEMP01051309.1.p1  ORF type:complete len:320 (+),score=75.11 GEMP01051309.1:67-1026(+)
MESIVESPSTITSTKDMTHEMLDNPSNGTSPRKHPNSIDVRRLLKRKAESEEKLEIIGNRIKRLEIQEETVWREVATTQKSSVRAQEARYRRQIKSFEGLQMEQATMQERHGRRNSALQLRLGLQEGRERRLLSLAANSHAAVQARFEAAERRKELRDAAEKEMQTKRSQVECVKNMKKKIVMKTDRHKSRLQSEQRNETMDQFSLLKEELRQLEIEIADAEEKEMKAIEKMQVSQNVRRETIGDFRPASRELRSQIGVAIALPSSPLLRRGQTTPISGCAQPQTKAFDSSGVGSARKVEWFPASIGQLGQIAEEEIAA